MSTCRAACLGWVGSGWYAVSCLRMELLGTGLMAGAPFPRPLFPSLLL